MQGQPFPDIKLQDQDGNERTLQEFLGTPFVVYFYPKDMTGGCTTEACEFNEALPDFGDVKVIGVSPDPATRHRKFADKYELGFTLLADPERQLIEALGLWVEKTLYGRKYMGVARTTYLVGADGNVLEVWEKVKPKGHAAAVLNRSKA